MRRLEPAECVVIIVDVQERLAAAMPVEQVGEVTRSATILMEACSVLGARLIATEQYSKGLGPTIAPVAARMRELGRAAIEKLTFSACDNPEFERTLAETGARSAIVLGMEAHVCVFQTVRDLVSRGLVVSVVADGTASRRSDHRAIGLDLCRASGATVTTTETVVFDWLRAAGTEPFRRLSKLIR